MKTKQKAKEKLLVRNHHSSSVKPDLLITFVCSFFVRTMASSQSGHFQNLLGHQLKQLRTTNIETPSGYDSFCDRLLLDFDRRISPGQRPPILLFFHLPTVKRFLTCVTPGTDVRPRHRQTRETDCWRIDAGKKSPVVSDGI